MARGKRIVIQLNQYQERAKNDYRWISKDPIIDEMMYLAKQDGRSLSSLAIRAWLSPTTVTNWYKGRTKRPNRISVEFFLRAMGYEMRIVKSDNPAKLPVYRWRAKK